MGSKVMVESKEVGLRRWKLLCQKSDGVANNIFSKFESGQNLEFPGNRFQFLLNRIKMLKTILIDKNNSIQVLWDRDTAPQRKMVVKQYIVERYLNDPEIRASIETLLFDCRTLLKSNGLIKL
ncbi:hypothetical protein AVEN_20342-1 [Araneus ventricosus]|uniref:Uncharacterized protein n=1 Tax=Araneus ventricosus TaxID=182803 RepID=A0A4Y2IP10_ARAVE|nr:hypothetical protein AVEN_20342-1 [Araneus ventricosus]